MYGGRNKTVRNWYADPNDSKDDYSMFSKKIPSTIRE
jgi:hypothetical protein